MHVLEGEAGLAAPDPLAVIAAANRYSLQSLA
jgi:hypothetical protein